MFEGTRVGMPFRRVHAFRARGEGLKKKVKILQFKKRELNTQ
jgi:hypothetical protein